MKTATDPELQKIIEDNSSGSKEILFNLNRYFLKTGFANLREPAETLKYLKSRFTDFAAIQNYLQKLLYALDEDKLCEAEKLISNFEKSEQSKIQKIYSSIKPYFTGKNSIVTISNSFTLLNIFTLLNRDINNLSITVSEARPNCEGKIFSENLAAESINVNLITEAMIPGAVKECGAVIIGADSILSNGSVVNKTGSLSLAIACKHYGKPFYVIADKSKMKQDSVFYEEEKNPAEIYSGQSSNIRTKNFYFEEIDNKLITKIFTD